VGYAVGFNTFNPALRKPDDQDGGLFKRRQP